MDHRRRGDFEEELEGSHPHMRRAGEQRLDIIANSPLLKVVGQFVTLVLLPLATWALTAVWSEVKSINESINKTNLTQALYEQRLTSLEHARDQRDVQTKAMNDKIVEHEIRLNALEKDDKK